MDENLKENLKNLTVLLKKHEGKQLITNEEFQAGLTDIINAFAQIRSATTQINKNTREKIETMSIVASKELEKNSESLLRITLTKLNDEFSKEKDILCGTASKLDKKTSSAISELNKKLREVTKITENIREIELPEIDQEGIIKETLKRIEFPTQIIDTSNEIVDKVNLSTNLIKKERIDGLVELIKNVAHNSISSLPATTTFVNGKRSKNLVFSGLDVNTQGDTSTITLGGSLSINTETPTGTVNGVNTSFTVLNTPKWISVDGLNKFLTTNYTYAAGTITITDGSPPVVSIITFY